MLKSIKMRRMKGKIRKRTLGKAAIFFVKKWRGENRMRKTVENLVENVKNKLRNWGKKEREERVGCKRCGNG